MVDFYGRVGFIEKAWDVIEFMFMEFDVFIWGVLLSGLRMYGNIRICEVVFRELIELEFLNSGVYVFFFNVYVKMGRWKDVRYIRDVMEVNGVKKV